MSGHKVKERFSELHFPAYSLPLWGWFVIGGLYYLVSFVILYRLFKLFVTPLRSAAFVLLLAMMALNALWNYFFFRRRNLFISFIIFLPYNLLALTVFMLLLKLDQIAALWLLPYLGYLIYAVTWAYGVWKLNGSQIHQQNAA